jgi:hypothetical protein
LNEVEQQLRLLAAGLSIGMQNAQVKGFVNQLLVQVN